MSNVNSQQVISAKSGGRTDEWMCRMMTIGILQNWAEAGKCGAIKMITMTGNYHVMNMI